MTHTEFRDTLSALGLNKTRAARLLGVNERTPRRWAKGEQDIPPPVVRFLQLMIALKLTPERVHKILDGK